MRHTHRLTEPWNQTFGDWASPDDTPETLIAILADLGRFYLPWVSRAVDEDSAELEFESGQKITIEATDFLKDARGVLLARYIELRSDELDAILDRAGILGYFADYADRAGTVPNYEAPPRPVLNDPFPSTISDEEILEMVINMGVDPTRLLPATE